MPDYDISDETRTRVTILGEIINDNYAHQVMIFSKSHSPKGWISITCPGDNMLRKTGDCGSPLRSVRNDRGFITNH